MSPLTANMKVNGLFVEFQTNLESNHNVPFHTQLTKHWDMKCLMNLHVSDRWEACGLAIYYRLYKIVDMACASLFHQVHNFANSVWNSIFKFAKHGYEFDMKCFDCVWKYMYSIAMINRTYIVHNNSRHKQFTAQIDEEQHKHLNTETNTLSQILHYILANITCKHITSALLHISTNKNHNSTQHLYSSNILIYALLYQALLLQYDIHKSSSMVNILTNS